MNTWIETKLPAGPDAIENASYTFTTPNDLAYARITRPNAGEPWHAQVTRRRDWSTKEQDFADLEQAKTWCEEIIAQS